MRTLVLLVTLVAAMPLSSWANSRIDIQSFQGKSHYSGDVFSTQPPGFNYSAMRGTNFSSALLGNVAFATRKLDGSFRQGGVWIEGKSDDGISRAGKRHNEHAKRGDDDRGDDGGDIAIPVPEPGTLSLLGAGLVGLAGVVRRRRSA